MTCLQKIYTCLSALKAAENRLSVIGNFSLLPLNMLTILQDHIFTLAQGAQFLGVLDIAQSSGEVFIHYTADVPLEIGEKNTPGIPLGLYRPLHLGGTRLYFFHCGTGDSYGLNEKYYWQYFSKWLGYSLVERSKQFALIEYKAQQPVCAGLRTSLSDQCSENNKTEF